MPVDHFKATKRSFEETFGKKGSRNSVLKRFQEKCGVWPSNLWTAIVAGRRSVEGPFANEDKLKMIWEQHSQPPADEGEMAGEIAGEMGEYKRIRFRECR